MSEPPISRRALLAGAIAVGGAAASVPAVLWATDHLSGSRAGSQESAAATRYPPKSRARDLPIIFERARVCGHNGAGLTPYMAQDGDVPAAVYYRNAEAWSILGARATVRPVKSRDEDPWWPSTAPSTSAGFYAGARTNVIHQTRLNQRTGRYEPDGIVRVKLKAGENLVSGWLAEADDHDVLMVAYYRYYNERSLAFGASTHGEPAHPSWVVKHQNGSIWMSPTGVWLDVTTPAYRDIVAARLVELSGYGVQAFYFDELGLPNAEGPRGTATAAAYTEQTGKAPPTAKVFRSTTPGALEWRQFCANRLADTYGIINSTLKASHPDAVFIASCTYLPGLTLPFHNTRMLAVIDCAKTEWEVAYKPGLQDNVFGNRIDSACGARPASSSCPNPDLARPHIETQRAMGWTLLRDGANGRPFHCWVAGTATAEQAAAAAAGIIAYGGIASMLGAYDTLSGILSATDKPVRGATPRAGLEAAFALSEVAGPYLANASPLRHAAVLYSEERRDALGKGDAKLAWQRVLWPTLGGFEGFLKARIPVGIVNDSQFTPEGLRGYQVLYVWDRSALSPAQATVVGQFEKSGGTVVTDPAPGRWSATESNATAVTAMAGLAARHRSTAPVSVTGSPTGMRAIAYSQHPGEGVTRLVVAVVNDFSHVQLTSVQTNQDLPTDPKTRIVHVPKPPPAAVPDAVVHWKQSVALDGRIFTKPTAAYCLVDQSPIRVPLQYAAGANDLYSAKLPKFQHLALVVVEY